MKQFITYFIFSCVWHIQLYAQKSDSLKSVVVKSTIDKKIITSPTPLQQLNANQISNTNSNTVADAIKQFAGVQIKDYGGVGGLKTISVRSLGANHTTIVYDGIAINNAQGGQIDLSRFTLENIEQIQLYNASPNEILTPAKTFASASILMLQTKSNNEKDTNNRTINLKIENGSFGYFSPSIVFKNRVSKVIRMAFSANFLRAANEYPFKSYEYSNEENFRTNSDIKSNKLEYDLNISLNKNNKINVKTFYYNSRRGLPGSIILYNNTSAERLNDDIFFTQASWHKKIFSKHAVSINTKWSYDKNIYINPNYANSSNILINEFHQKEFYLSAAYKYTLNKNIELAFANDYFKSHLKRTDEFVVNFAKPTRNNFLTNISSNVKFKKVQIAANILHTGITEAASFGSIGKNYNKLTPAISISYKPISNHDFYVRAFYKNIFRAPTFNDMYYTNIGNTNLKPEIVNQFNTGITYSKPNVFNFFKINITADAYYNKVKDKILAVPRQNLFQWSMQNIGKVDIKGLDITVQLIFKEIKNIKFTTSLSYTYQQALDLSDKNVLEYKTQIPYTPMHTGSFHLDAAFKKIIINYNFLGSSLRFRQGALIAENALNPWASHDFSIIYTTHNQFKIIAEANNIFNTPYEIIKYYPMPGFNYRLSIHLKLNSKK